MTTPNPTRTRTTNPTSRTTSAPTPSTPARTRLLLAGGLAAGPLFLAAGIAQGLARDGFDFTRNAISQLALGTHGWIQTANFLLAAILLTAAATGLHRLLRSTPGDTWAPRLVAVFGASFLAAAVFPADAGAGFPAGSPDTTRLSTHGAVHMVSGMIGYLALCAAFLVLARSLATCGRRGWALASRLVPLAVLAGFAGSAATVLSFTFGAALGLTYLSAVLARLLADRPQALADGGEAVIRGRA